MITDVNAGHKALNPLYRKYSRTRARQLHLTWMILLEVQRELYKHDQYQAAFLVDDLRKPIERAQNRIFASIINEGR